jgi:threonine synthase
MLLILEETGFFAASLYIPTAIMGIETLGYELAQQVKEREGRFPDMVVIAHAGGGNVTGTARGLQKAGSHKTVVVGASVDLRGLHMASDNDFNRKSFTTAHSGFGFPFLALPDRTDVPRNAARALRYLDRYVLISQGEVFYVTQLLAKLEGLERGPAGNTSLAAAIALAKELDQDQILVVQETEYTAAGKLPSSQLTFAEENEVEVRRGDPRENVPGKIIVVPERVEQMRVENVNLDKIRQSYIENVVEATKGYRPTEADVRFIAEDLKSSAKFTRRTFGDLGIKVSV